MLLGTLDDFARAFSHLIPYNDASWFYAYGCWFGLVGFFFFCLCLTGPSHLPCTCCFSAIQATSSVSPLK